jgi:hypothetical protein
MLGAFLYSINYPQDFILRMNNTIQSNDNRFDPPDPNIRVPSINGIN